MTAPEILFRKKIKKTNNIKKYSSRKVSISPHERHITLFDCTLRILGRRAKHECFQSKDDLLQALKVVTLKLR